MPLQDPSLCITHRFDTHQPLPHTLSQYALVLLSVKMFGGTMTTESAERTARGFFLAGFLFLPWLWFANVALFWEMRGENAVVDLWVQRSAAAFGTGCVVFAVAMVVLYTVGQDWDYWIIKPNGDSNQRGMFANAF